MKGEEKKVLEFLEGLKGLKLLDVLAIGNILGVEEIDPFEDYVTELAAAFLKKPRKERRELLKLQKDVRRDNRILNQNNK